jgi:hypothetical protein
MVSLLWHGRLGADDVEGIIKSRSPVRKRGFVALLTTGKITLLQPISYKYPNNPGMTWSLVGASILFAASLTAPQ